MKPAVLNSSCEPCRASKVKCSGERCCKRCVTKGLTCVYHPRKRRGKPTNSTTSSLKSESVSTAEPIGFGSEVLEFGLENQFPIKFINGLLRSGIFTFQMAASFNESDLMDRFGPLEFDKLVLWRAKLRDSKLDSLLPTQSTASSVISEPVKGGSCLNFGLLPTFADSHCAQILSNFKQQAIVPRPVVEENPPCMLQTLCETFMGRKKRKCELEDEEHVLKKQKSEVQERMQVVDWLISVLQRLSSVCCTNSLDCEESKSESEQDSDNTIAVDCLKQCVKEISTKLESMPNYDQKWYKTSLCQLKETTFYLISGQLELLKSKLKDK